MKRVTTKLDIGASRIQERVALLAEQFSQSEVSRRTSTPVSNVNRYINGTRIPADFCSELVAGMGVNPAWLLTGEGAMFLSDVTAGTGNMAKDMLELVDAMNAVSRMRLGSLTGKHHLRVLKELNDALGTYRDLRHKLNERSVPILSQLLDDARRYHDQQQFEVVADLVKAGRQIADFCEDRDQLRRLQATEANFEFATGRPEKALAISREVFARTLTGSDKLDNNSIIQAHNLVATLCQNFLFKEARRVARAAVELAGDQLEGLEAGYELLTLTGIVEVELGNLAEGLGRIATNFPRTSKIYLTHSIGPVLRAQLMAGAMSFDDVDRKGGVSLGKGRHMVRYAIWLEDADKLNHVMESYVGAGGRELVNPESLECVHARQLAGMLTRKRKSALASARREIEQATTHPLPVAMAEVLGQIFSAQLALAAGDGKRASTDVLKVEESLNDLPSGVSLDMLTRALHSRNVLRALPEDVTGSEAGIRRRAAAFFSVHRAKGYNFLAAG